MSWKRLDDPPSWIKKIAVEKRVEEGIFDESFVVRGETYVYKIEIGIKNHGHDYTFYRQLKSEYHSTTPERGTCPNCQKFVRRYEDDDYLTCHRCGWQYKPISERLKNLF